MRNKTNGNAVVVAVELGAEWPHTGVPITPSTSSAELASIARRVVCQEEGEGPAEFAERVARSLDAGLQPSTFALACNERLDDAAQGARRRLAGLVLGAMAKRRAGKLYLTASSRSSGRLRHALSATAHGLFQEWRTAGLEVSVDFGDQHDSSSASSEPLPAPAARVA